EPIKDLSEKAESKNEPEKRSRQISPAPPVSHSPTLPLSTSPVLANIEQSGLQADDKSDSQDLVKEEVIAVATEQEPTKDEESAESEKKMELSKVAGVSAPMAAKGRSVSEQTPPQPVAGIDSFNIYIEKNIRVPDTRGDRDQTVIISFIVNTDSTLSDFRIIGSPGESFSREAKRLIKEGPRWKPATENGIPVKEETRIRIVFR
ncbi:MAG: energy transducer TonB, partial [Bacteroidia bacterium]|nr:energy transducer TonB [Bacteroidia bacterium]